MKKKLILIIPIVIILLILFLKWATSPAIDLNSTNSDNNIHNLYTLCSYTNNSGSINYFIYHDDKYNVTHDTNTSIIYFEDLSEAMKYENEQNDKCNHINSETTNDIMNCNVTRLNHTVSRTINNKIVDYSYYDKIKQLEKEGYHCEEKDR